MQAISLHSSATLSIGKQVDWTAYPMIWLLFCFVFFLLPVSYPSGQKKRQFVTLCR